MSQENETNKSFSDRLYEGVRKFFLGPKNEDPVRRIPIPPDGIDGVTCEALKAVDKEWAQCKDANKPPPPPRPSDPFALDLDGDGIISTTGSQNGVFFDHDGDGIRALSGWIGKNDGLLAWDKDGNGQIDNGGELFGEHSVLKNGQKAKNGFEALADLDSNGDGVFNAQDEHWQDVRIWRDASEDGKADTGELLSFEELGIASISLQRNAA